ncbi:HEAT repeat domain-containing protein [Kutzneria chonburiensis]|uniref:HEAT repeat domain-containing protein n=1 Tax=Kutzneria chonburiensis TaxID=1483604 RepID=A0ABV6MQV0_9PSEU|nr:HEAT repeat domain-containing protein [Kutzneria chonburiensis]
MGDILDDVDWSKLRHLNGTATDLPELLRACASRNPDTALAAIGELYDKLHHEGWEVTSAGAAALPWLAELATTFTTRHRKRVVELLEYQARAAMESPSGMVAEGWWPALDVARPKLLALLDDQDPVVRRKATLLVADGIHHPEAIAALRHRLAVENDRVTKADVVLALGAAYSWSGDEGAHADLIALLRDEDLQYRLAAVHALANTHPAVAAENVESVVKALMDSGVALWALSEWIDGEPSVMVNYTRHLLVGHPAAAAVLESAFDRRAARLAEDRARAEVVLPREIAPDLAARAATVANAVRVFSEWRKADAVLPLVGACLDDDDPTVRYRAAALLACLGRQAAQYVDQLLALSSDSTPYDQWKGITVGDAAVWALARQGHPGCLPALVERLSGDRLGFDVAHAYFGREVHRLAQPALSDILIPLRDNADVLLGPVVARRDRPFAPQLCEIVAAWESAEALPVLVDMLAEGKLRPLAAKAIGAIGVDAAGAADALRANASEPAVAWALWRTGVDRDRGIAELTGQVKDAATLALVADLGADAAGCVDAVRELAESADDRVRVEAVHALWRITGERRTAVLADLAEPSRPGQISAAGIVALRHLAAMGEPDDRVQAIARSIVDSARRIACHGGWRAFTEDEEIRAVATKILG